MSESLFSRNLAYFRQELRDLKTSHPIAVGSLNFYQKSGTATTTQFIWGIYVRMTVKPGEPLNPFAQVFFQRNDEAAIIDFIQYQSIENNGEIIQYYFAVHIGSFIVSAICSSDFDLIVKSYEDGDWIGEEPE